MDFRLGELFYGPGEMAYGAKLARSQTSAKNENFSISYVWWVDHDANAISTYNASGMGEGVYCDAMAFVKGC